MERPGLGGPGHRCLWGRLPPPSLRVRTRLGLRRPHHRHGDHGLRIGWRGSTPDQDIWTQVCSVSPYHRAALNADIAEHLWLAAKLLKHRATHQLGDIPLNNGIIGESKTKAKAIQELNPPEAEQSQYSSPLFMRCDNRASFTDMPHVGGQHCR